MLQWGSVTSYDWLGRKSTNPLSYSSKRSRKQHNWFCSASATKHIQSTPSILFRKNIIKRTGHSSTLIQFPFAVLHNCNVFPLRPHDYLLLRPANCSDSEVGKKATRCCVIALLAAFGVWSLVLDWLACHQRGNLIAVGHLGLPPLARGLYSEQGHGRWGLKTRPISFVIWAADTLKSGMYDIIYFTEHKQGDMVHCSLGDNSPNIMSIMKNVTPLSWMVDKVMFCRLMLLKHNIILLGGKTVKAIELSVKGEVLEMAESCAV